MKRSKLPRIGIGFSTGRAHPAQSFISHLKRRMSTTSGAADPGALPLPQVNVEKDPPSQSQSSGRKGAARRGGRGGKMDRQVVVSKALSKLLRHRAAEAGITLDDEGFAPLDKVLSSPPIKSIKATLEDIQSVVATNDKQRFLLKPKPNPLTNPSGSLSTSSPNPSDYLIRANQGHSIRLESASLMEPLSVKADNIPPRVLHGTYFATWPAILASGGLRPMGRNHVHCSVGLPDEEGVVSGMRRDAELVIDIDVRRSMEEGGLRWWRSENGVVLTEGDGEGLVGLKWFRRVEGRRGDVGVLWEDGEERGELPEGLAKGRGKRR